MFFIILFIIFLIGLTFIRKFPLDEAIPIYIASISCLVGIVLLNFSNSLYDTFLLFEIITIGLYSFSSRNFHDFLTIKLCSYLPIVFMKTIGLGYESYCLVFYFLCNSMSFTCIKLRFNKMIIAPVLAFQTYAVLSISQFNNFEINSLVLLVTFALLVASLFYKIELGNLTHTLIVLLTIESLLFLNHSKIFVALIVVLFLIYLATISLPQFVSNITVNNIVVFLILLCIVPLFKYNLVFLMAGLSLVMFKNYQTYKFNEVIYE